MSAPPPQRPAPPTGSPAGGRLPGHGCFRAGPHRPQLADAEARVAAREAQERAHRRYTRIDHPEVPRRLEWLEREMDTLSAPSTSAGTGLMSQAPGPTSSGISGPTWAWACRRNRPNQPGSETTLFRKPSRMRYRRSCRSRSSPGTSGTQAGPVRRQSPLPSEESRSWRCGGMEQT